MPSIKLTKTAVAQLEAPTSPDPDGKHRQKLYWDTEWHGLGVLCSAKTNIKSWVCQGAIRSGVTRRITLGATNVLDRRRAWELAQPILSEMLAGRDPKEERQRQNRASATVEQVLEDYLARSRLTPKSIATYRSTAQRHLAPWLGRTIRSIGPDDVEALYDAIPKDVAERQAAGDIRGGLNVQGRATANAAMQLFRAVWNHQAERDEGLGQRNPVNRLKKQWHELERRNRRIHAEDLPRFYQAALALPNTIQRDLVILDLFTGLRDTEVSGSKWEEEVDLQQKIICLPAGRMKAKKAFDLPMSDFVHDLLVARRSVGYAGPYVFPGNGRKGYCQSFAFALDQIRDAIGLKVSPHDLRRTYASVAATCEIPAVAVKLLIAHAAGPKNDVTAGYTILSLPDLRRAAQRVCDKMKELCGIPTLGAGNVARLA